MSTLEIRDLHVSVGDTADDTTEILKGVELLGVSKKDLPFLFRQDAERCRSPHLGSGCISGLFSGVRRAECGHDLFPNPRKFRRSVLRRNTLELFGAIADDSQHRYGIRDPPLFAEGYGGLNCTHNPQQLGKLHDLY